MPDPNTIPVVPQTLDDDTGRALVGKIARLPRDIREQLNHRLENGRPASEILPWLNDLPAVKTVLDRHFNGVPVSDANLTNWRQGGYQRWLEKQEPLARIKELAEDAANISRTGGPSLVDAAATILSSQILETLQTVSSGKLSPAQLANHARAITALINARQNNIRLQHEQTRLCQRDHEILLKRDKHQRDVITIEMNVLGDARAKEIHSSSICYAEKIELLGRNRFGDLWEPRFVPAQAEPTNQPAQ